MINYTFDRRLYAPLYKVIRQINVLAHAAIIHYTVVANDILAGRIDAKIFSGSAFNEKYQGGAI